MLLLDCVTGCLSQAFDAATKGVEGIILLATLEKFSSITCFELNDYLFSLFKSSSINFESLGIPVVVAAGAHVLGRLAAVLDGDRIKIIIAHPTAKVVVHLTPEAIVARAQRDEIKQIENKRALRTSPPKWVHKNEAEKLGLDVDEELAYVNKFLSTNYVRGDRNVGVIIHPDHEDSLQQVICICCGTVLSGDAALKAGKLWHKNYETHLLTSSCKKCNNPALSDAAIHRLEQAKACTRPMPISINNV